VDGPLWPLISTKVDSFAIDGLRPMEVERGRCPRLRGPA
jgi:hypothetical protein